MKPNDFITIGVIIAPHGVRGDLRIMPQTDFQNGLCIWMPVTSMVKNTTLHPSRFHKQFVLASFKEIPDRNTAELFSKKQFKSVVKIW